MNIECEMSIKLKKLRKWAHLSKHIFTRAGRRGGGRIASKRTAFDSGPSSSADDLAAGMLVGAQSISIKANSLHVSN